MKLWGGRFNREPAELVHLFNASINFDKRLYSYDIKGSIVHVEMLTKSGIISKEESKKIIKGLEGIKRDIENGNIMIDDSSEDIHSFIEKELIERIGSDGGKMHTARSRNDQVALDMRLFLRKEIKELQKLIKGFLQILLELSKKYIDIYMPGYTHLQR